MAVQTAAGLVATTAAGTEAGPVATAGTLVLFAVFISVTAHLAARNVLGDVPFRRALAVGIGPSTVAVAGTALGVPALVTLPTAVLVDWIGIYRSYDGSRGLAVYIVLIHFVISILIGTVFVSVALLLASRPG
jgi:hypothetical protein